MKTMIQLSADRTKAHWKWQWDEVHPLSEMFTPEIVALMVDVTGTVPEPDEGWNYAEGMFTTPPLRIVTVLTPEELLAKLEAAKQELTDLLDQVPAVTDALNTSIQAAGAAEVVQ